MKGWRAVGSGGEDPRGCRGDEAKGGQVDGLEIKGSSLWVFNAVVGRC